MAWVFTGNSLSETLLTLAIPLEVSFEETMPANERLVVLLDALRNLKKPCLLVIDNANEVTELEDHYLALRSCANFHVLLTTRITEFEHTATHRIEPLEKISAFELFKKHYPGHKAVEDVLLNEILIAVGYNTLVIELLAKNLHNLNRLKIHYSITELLDDLQHRGLLGLGKSAAVGTAHKASGYTLLKEKPELDNFSNVRAK
ncbi:hypothetical protein EXU57_24075 [Segetibacter sp. 3557_3]|uniref:hypothetical protein n=1 Tax=Segetibacter sp. 3557_3 TaxID=2547429 RepID=UPI0010591F44|nr:hypothetical protein [Segetibacter sp. 3557_3]TDH18259.1 hypothetical protein EXU57_24075 [Segetibacter sp. 3557_3]